MSDDAEQLLEQLKPTLGRWSKPDRTRWDYPNGWGSRILSDGYGEIAIVAPLEPPERRYEHPTRDTCRAVVTAKRGPYTPPRSSVEYASFMPRVIGWALTRESVLIQAYGSGEPAYHVEDCWVFDAKRVANQASERERNAVDSKRARNVTVFDVSRSAHGIGLGDWLSRQGRCPAPDADGLTPTTLARFDIEPEGVLEA